MINLRHLSLAAAVLALAATVVDSFGEGDVTVVPTSSSQPQPPEQQADNDGTPVVHKSAHKKKAVTVTASPPAATTNTTNTKPIPAPAPVTAPPHATVTASTPPAPSHPGGNVTVGPPPAPVTPSRPPPAISPKNVAVVKGITITAPPPAVLSTPIAPTSMGPTPTLSPSVETGLPVAHYSGVGSPIKGVNTYVPPAPVVPPPKTMAGSTTHQPYFASALPGSVFSVTPVAAGSFTTPGTPIPPPASSRTTTTGSSDLVFTSLSRKTKLNYPWKTGIITTMFYIGEGGSSISPTDNIASAWDEHWRSSNRGTDTPNDRNGFAPADHAATVNPFYVALPFNDLAFPDKARVWLPRGWSRRPINGKQISACKDRWVEIKNSRGDICFAQWEDVGPLTYDDAEYVFGGAKPRGLGGDRAGLDVSPAVYEYLGLSDRNRFTAWKFADESDVRPGAWLKLDEQAVIFTALEQLKNRPLPSAPIQRNAEPSDDPTLQATNKKKVQNAN